jgi:serine/threonine protein kinase
MQEGGEEKLKLLNSGAFGCIYRPSLTCKGNVGSVKYITKIQKSKRAIGNEIFISERVRNINGYTRFFAPILKYCNVRIAKDHVDDLKQCEVFKDESNETIKKSSYVSMKTRYVGNKDLRDYLLSDIRHDVFLTKLWKTHTFLLKAIQKLCEHKIVHFDLKSNNIMIDSVRTVPIIIDFGQSWATDQLKTPEKISNIFFVFEQYDYWCIDILICCYIAQELKWERAKVEMVNEAELKHIYDTCVYGRKPEPEPGSSTYKPVNDVYMYSILETPERKNEYWTRMNMYMERFINKRTWLELYEDLIKYTNTWDSYSLAVIYMNMLDDVFLSKPEVYNTYIGQKLTKYVETMENILYSAPDERPAIKTTLIEVESLLKPSLRA